MRPQSYSYADRKQNPTWNYLANSNPLFEFLSNEKRREMIASSFRTMVVLLGPESKGRNYIRIIYEKIKKRNRIFVACKEKREDDAENEEKDLKKEGRWKINQGKEEKEEN